MIVVTRLAGFIAIQGHSRSLRQLIGPGEVVDYVKLGKLSSSEDDLDYFREEGVFVRLEVVTFSLLSLLL